MFMGIYINHFEKRCLKKIHRSIVLMWFFVGFLVVGGCHTNEIVIPGKGSVSDVQYPELTWVPITGGRFNMGSTTTVDEQPVHSVIIPPFEILETEVTVVQYLACVEATTCQPPGSGSYTNWEIDGREHYPVTYVSWHQAAEFCAWIGGRLPSEAEWEYAASNGSEEDEFPWGNTPATCYYAVMDDGNDGCGMGLSWEVCSKTAGNTNHGLCDMAGNVWEWVEDWYHSNYEEAPTDGSAWLVPSGTSRVIRGGSFAYSVALRASERGEDPPSSQLGDLGFRCAR